VWLSLVLPPIPVKHQKDHRCYKTARNPLMNSMEHEFKLVQEEYGRNMLNLVVVVGYLRRLLSTAAAVRFLSQAEPTMLAEFQKIMDQADLRAAG